MGFHRVTLQKNYTYGFHGYGACCNSYNPFMSYNFNCFYNPLTIFSTAMQLMNGKLPTFTNINQPFYFKTPSYSNFTLPMISGDVPNFNSLYNGISTYQPQTYRSEPFIADNLNFINNDNSEFDIFDDFYKKAAGVASPKNHYAKNYKSSYTTLSANHLNKEFLEKVKQVAKNLNCDYEDLLAVMNSESGLQPDKWNGSSAVGLIQFTNSALAELKRVYGINLTKEQVSKMSALEQLDLAEKYLKITTKKFGGKKLSAADLYASVYLPGRAKNEVLTRRGENYYEGNKGLDENKDGIITKTDLNNHLAKKRVRLETFA